MTEPHVTAARDQLMAESADQTAEELIHTIGHCLRIYIQWRLDPQPSTPRDSLLAMDKALLALTDMVTGWLNGPHHTCTKRHADNPFGE